MSDEKERSGLTYSQRERINLDVLMGVIPPANESLEAAECRRIATIEIREILDKGGMVMFPTDWDADDEEATVEASEPDKGSGGIPGGDSLIAGDKTCRIGEGEPSAGLETAPAALGPAPLPAPVPEGSHPSSLNNSLDDA